MPFVAGAALLIAGVTILLLPGRFVRAEQKLYAPIVGARSGRILTRLVLVMVAATLIASGTALIAQTATSA
ncbi:hypothetical protein ACFQZ8_03205 [Micromonospora azadirachtae]|uniref:Uncharacterized protein n=1 Tax=Micromonospora azadirachtae TaxID=1970735 RepID=A0ABW2ZWA9_9ACTN